MSKEPTAIFSEIRKCSTRHFGFRIALVAFGYDGADLHVLLKKRVSTRSWALPYKIPKVNEPVHETAAQLRSELLPGNEKSSLEQVYTFDLIPRKRRRWIITGYSTIIPVPEESRKPTAPAEWCSLDRRPMLTRLEDQVIEKSVEALKRKVRHEPVGFYMLPPEFTLQQLQRMYELFLGEPISKQSFRKKMWESEILIPLEDTITERGRTQPKGLYRFNKKKYFELKRSGFFLDL